MSLISFQKDYLSYGTENGQVYKQEDKLGVCYSNLAKRWWQLRWIRMVTVEVVKKRLDFECNLWVLPTRSCGCLDVGYKRKKSRATLRFLAVSTGWTGLPSTEKGRI